MSRIQKKIRTVSSTMLDANARPSQSSRKFNPPKRKTNQAERKWKVVKKARRCPCIFPFFSSSLPVANVDIVESSRPILQYKTVTQKKAGKNQSRTFDNDGAIQKTPRRSTGIRQCLPKNLPSLDDVLFIEDMQCLPNRAYPSTIHSYKPFTH